MDNSLLKPFTVIGLHGENWQLFCEHVEAHNKTHAFAVCAGKEDYEGADFVCALDGHQCEGESIAFVGTTLLDAQSIVSQPDVFC